MEQHQKPVLQEPRQSSSCPQLLAGRGSRAAPETFCCHTPAAAPSPCGLQPSCGAQQQGQQQATMYAPHHARGRRLPTALSPRLKQVQRASSPRHIPPAPRPPGQPHTGSVPAPQPRGKGQGAAGRPKNPPGAARPARRPLPPAPSRHSPDSASELVARLRAAGGRSVRRGQRGARAGPSRRTASHAIFAGRPEAGRCRAELPPHGGGRGRHFLTAPSRLSARGGQRGCLGISAVCRWREGGREAPGMCGKAPVAAASLGK